MMKKKGTQRITVNNKPSATKQGAPEFESLGLKIHIYFEAHWESYISVWKISFLSLLPTSRVKYLVKNIFPVAIKDSPGEYWEKQ